MFREYTAYPDLKDCASHAQAQTTEPAPTGSTALSFSAQMRFLHSKVTELNEKRTNVPPQSPPPPQLAISLQISDAFINEISETEGEGLGQYLSRYFRTHVNAFLII